jgi:hypothetical protein
MEAQLRLLAEARSVDTPEAPASWRIDATTKEVGRSGIAMAREALRRARHHDLAEVDPSGPSHTVAA